MKKINEEAVRRPDESIQEWQQKYQQAEEALKQEKEKIVLLESRTKEMEVQQHSTQTEFGNQLREKDNIITGLRRQSAHQQDEVRQAAEQIDELEEYVKIQESYFADQLVAKEMQLSELTEKHVQEQAEWTAAKAALEQQCSAIQVVSEQRGLELLVVQAKLMQAEGATKAQVTDLRQALADAQFRMTMGEDKIRAILRRHKINTLKMVTESMEKGWKTWSAQAAELQLLRADRENRKAQGHGFFKMTEEAISTIQEDIAKDLSEIAACHQEEVNRLMQEFDKHDIDSCRNMPT